MGENGTPNHCICESGWEQEDCDTCRPYWECPNQVSLQIYMRKWNLGMFSKGIFSLKTEPIKKAQILCPTGHTNLYCLWNNMFLKKICSN